MGEFSFLLELLNGAVGVELVLLEFGDGGVEGGESVEGVGRGGGWIGVKLSEIFRGGLAGRLKGVGEVGDVREWPVVVGFVGGGLVGVDVFGVVFGGAGLE